jgi:uncharacterized protein with WD repeat
VIYLQAALGLIQLINWVMSKIDEEKRAKAMAALWDQEFMARDKELRDEAARTRAAINRDLEQHPERLRSPDQFERP